MDRHEVLNQPEKYDKSMINHPPPHPPKKWLYHISEAPAGKQFPMEVALKMLEENKGWVATPAAFKDPAASTASADRNKAVVVDQAVAEELGKRKLNAPGVFEGEIEDPEDWKKLKKADVVDFIYFHRLLPEVDDTMSAADLKVLAKSLMATHNSLYQKQQEKEARQAELDAQVAGLAPSTEE